MKILNNPALFLKGTCEVTVKRPADGQIVFQSSLVSTNSFTTEVDMSPIRAGLGNTIAIQLPSDSAVNLELTTADFSMQARAMQIGTEVAFNAIAQKCATVTAESATLTIPDASPVACYGDGEAYCYVNFAGANDPGKAYVISDAGVVQDFTATPGTAYNVMYYERRADAQEIGISGMIAPGIYTVSAQMAVFSADGNNAGNRGSQVGWAYYYIPRMQFAGNAETQGSQTDPATSVLSGTALSYQDAAEVGACVDCSFPMLAYMTYVPLTFNGNKAISALAVVGGNIAVDVSEELLIPVKYVMADNTLVQPKYSDLTFTVADTTKATVENGVLTGVAAGNTTLQIGVTSGDSNVETITVGVVVSA